MSDHQIQVDQNYDAFMKRLPELLRTHAGKFALMRDGEIVEFFDTARDAFVAGQNLYKEDTLFESIPLSVEISNGHPGGLHVAYAAFLSAS
jgi:hypothetical protein